MRTFSITVFLILCTALSNAQPMGGPGHGPGFERIERFKKMRLVEMLELKEEQSVRFFARHTEMENNRRALEKQRDEILDKIERLVRNKAEDKEYERLFADLEAVNRQIGEEKQKFFNGLGDLLTVEQQAKLLLFERRFEKELREAVREAQQRRRGRSGDL